MVNREKRIVDNCVYTKIVFIGLLGFFCFLLTTCNSEANPEKLTSILFPQAPLEGKMLQVPNLVNKENPLEIQIKNPVLALPPKYPSVTINTNSPLKGELVYSLRLLHKFIILQSLGVTGKIQNTKSTFAAYPMQAYDVVYDPQFSHDGNFLLFKVGWPFEARSTYDLYLWDFKQGSLEQVADYLSSSSIHWSDSGQWIAYATGANQLDENNSSTQKVVLVTQELGTNKKINLKLGVSSTGISWTPQETILFSVPPESGSTDAPPIKGEPGKYDWTKQPRYSVYEGFPEKQLSRKLIDDARKPVPSPDGNLIAYIGWSDKMPGVSENTLEAESKGDKIPHQVLAVFERKTGRSKLMQDTLPDFMLWTQGAKQLITSTSSYKRTKEGGLKHTAHISSIDLNTMTTREIAQLDAQDFKPINRNITSPQFYPMGFAANGQYLLMGVSEYPGLSSPQSVYYMENLSMQAIDLNSGKISKVANIKNGWAMINGWDWHDMSDLPK